MISKELRSIAALLASTFAMMVGTGLAGMLIPLRAVLEDWSPTAIGWIGTCYAIAFTAGCLVTPILVKRVGHIRIFAALQTLLGASLLLHALVVNPITWCLFRALGGMALAGGYMVVESWLNEKADNANRGKIFSAYMVVSMTGVAAGQYIVPFGDIGTSVLFMVGTMAFSMSMLPISLSTSQAPRPLTRVTINPKRLFQRSPAAMVGSFLAGVIFGVWNYFGPLYGQALGLSSTGIATMLASGMIGGVVFQYPIGRLSDMIDRRYVMALAGAVGVAISVGMIIIAPKEPLYIVLGIFALGSVLFPIYALNIAHANDSAQPEEFVEVSGGLLIVYGIGNMVGPQLGGRLMDAAGPNGFFIAIGGTYAVYGFYAFWRSLRTQAVEPSLRSDFQIVPVIPAQTPETVAMDARTSD